MASIPSCTKHHSVGSSNKRRMHRCLGIGSSGAPDSKSFFWVMLSFDHQNHSKWSSFFLSSLEPKNLRMIILTIILVQVLCCLYQSPKHYIEIWHERPFSLQLPIVLDHCTPAIRGKDDDLHYPLCMYTVPPCVYKRRRRASFKGVAIGSGQNTTLGTTHRAHALLSPDIGTRLNQLLF